MFRKTKKLYASSLCAIEALREFLSEFEGEAIQFTRFDVTKIERSGSTSQQADHVNEARVITVSGLYSTKEFSSSMTLWNKRQEFDFEATVTVVKWWKHTYWNPHHVQVKLENGQHLLGSSWEYDPEQGRLDFTPKCHRHS